MDIRNELRRQHPALFDEVFVANSYQVNPGDVRGKHVIDVGANRGFFSLLCQWYGAKKVLAVEAHPVTYTERLVPNVKRFGRVIEPVLAAVTGVGGQTVMISDDDVKAEVGRGSTATTTVTLDAIMPPGDDDVVLKLDCEGSEFDILRSSPQALKRVSTLFIEIHGDLQLGERMLADLGFAQEHRSQLYRWDLDAAGNKVNMEPIDVCVYKYTRKRAERVLCSICTRERYDILPLALQAVAHQTRVPDHLVVFDTNETIRDLREDPIYRHIFRLLTARGITWEVKCLPGKGQHVGHNLANYMGYDLVWRLDDDEAPMPDVLERLLSHMAPDVGAVGGAVVVPGAEQPGGTGKIEDVYHTPNIQWARGASVVSVEHLYSSFVYRAGVLPYRLDLSPVAHREETIFTHQLKRAGYKLIVDLGAVTYHYRQERGGIRSHDNKFFYEHDERIFHSLMEEWGTKLIKLDGGLGDHYAFLNVLPALKKRFKTVIIGCCYPEVFEGQGVKIVSVAAAQSCQDNVYKWMTERGWKRSLVEAFGGMYGVEVSNDLAGDTGGEAPERSTEREDATAAVLA